MKLSKFLKILTTCLLVLHFNIGHSQTCMFTYEQGYLVGCGLAQTANANGCYQISCAKAYNQTINQFGPLCLDYTNGVTDGFFDCFDFQPFQNNQTNDPLNNPNNINDADCDNPVYINHSWECP